MVKYKKFARFQPYMVIFCSAGTGTLKGFQSPTLDYVFIVQIDEMMDVKYSIWITALLCTTCYAGHNNEEIYLNMEEIPAMRLYRNLSMHYVKQRPVLHYNDTLQVEVFLRLFQLLDLDSSSETMTVTGEFHFKWTDSFLKWRLEDFPGITILSIPANEIWIPDISIINSAGEVRNRDWLHNTNVNVNYRGNVIYKIRSQFKVTCDFDMTRFPGDEQTCSILLALQTYWQRKVNLTFTKEHTDIDITMYDDDGEWDLIGSSVKSMSYEVNAARHGKYSALSFSLTYKRLVSSLYCTQTCLMYPNYKSSTSC